MSDGLAEWLLEQIAVDEAGAGAHHRVLCMRIACDADGCVWGEDEQDAMERERVCTCGYPARVVADCEAKRRIVELHSYPMPACYWSHDSGAGHDPGEVCETLALMGLSYADRPGYREEWRP